MEAIQGGVQFPARGQRQQWDQERRQRRLTDHELTQQILSFRQIDLTQPLKRSSRTDPGADAQSFKTSYP